MVIYRTYINITKTMLGQEINIFSSQMIEPKLYLNSYDIKKLWFNSVNHDMETFDKYHLLRDGIRLDN